MVSIWLVWLLVLGAPLSARPTETEQDEVAARLQTAKERYAAQIQEARDQLLAALTASEKAAEENPPAVERLQLDRTAFEKSGVLPASIPEGARIFEHKRNEAEEGLLNAYEAAAQAYLASSLHDLADRIEEEEDAFRKGYQRDSWVDLRCRLPEPVPDDESSPVWNGPCLVFDGEEQRVLRIDLPTIRPRQPYRLRLELERTAGDGEVQVLFPRRDVDVLAQGLLVLGGWGGATSGLELVDGKPANDNSTTCSRTVFEKGKVASIVLECTAEGIAVSVGGGRLLEWSDPERLQLPDGVADSFRKFRKNAFLLVSKGTQVRLDGLLAETLPPPPVQQAEKGGSDESGGKHSETPEVADALSQGTGWSGSFGKDNTCTVEVIARNRSEKTASLRMIGGGKAVWRLDLSHVSDDGSDFRVENLTLVRPAPGAGPAWVTLKSGNGRVRKGKLSLSWKADIKSGGKRSQTFNGDIRCD